MSSNPDGFIHNDDVIVVIENIHTNNGSDRNFRIWDGDFKEVATAKFE